VVFRKSCHQQLHGPPGQLTPWLRTERDLAQARLTASNGEQGVAASFTDAISGVREHGSLYHLAHGLLDQAAYLIRLGATEAAETAIGEACGIADRLRCQPLLDRAADLTAARPPVQA